MARGRSITRQDVARLAGVSGAAVSAVLNGTRGNIQVSAQTRERILAAARQLNYRANPAAQALRRQGANTLGVVVQPPTRASYYQSIHLELAHHVRIAAARHGYEVAEIAEYGNEPDDQSPVRLLSNTPLAGLLVVGEGHSTRELRSLSESGLPIVQMLRPEPGFDAAAVTVDPRPGIAAAVDHLIELGHQRIAYVGSRSSHVVDRGRLKAFQQSMANRGLRVSDRFVHLCEYEVGDGVAALDEVLSLKPSPTALVVGADVIALGILRRAYARQLRIPDQLSLISYDDVLADIVAPAMTSVAQPLEAVAVKAIDVLLAAIRGEDDSRSSVTSIPTMLRIRESTGPVPTAS